ncbi:MAG: sigma-70 family RNA polymerase sigma factor [Bacteroidota bacterium]
MFGKKRTYTDQAIIEGIKTGGANREKAINQLFDSNLGFLHTVRKKLFLSLEEAQDAYADAIVKVASQISLGKFRGESKISTYLYKIFYNKCVDVSRKKASNTATWVEEYPELSDPASDLLQKLDVKDEVVQLRKVMANMGEACKNILLDWAYMGYSMEEIAQRRNLKTPESARSLKYKCLKKLRELLLIKKPT